MEEIKEQNKAKNKKIRLVIGIILVVIAVVLILYKAVLKNILVSNQSDSDYFTTIVMNNLAEPNNLIAAEYVDYRDNCKTYGEIHKDSDIIYNYDMNALLQVLTKVLPVGIGEAGTYEYAKRGDDWKITNSKGEVVKEYVNESTISFSAMCTDFDISESGFRKILEKLEKVLVERIATGVVSKKNDVIWTVNEVSAVTTVCELEFNQTQLVALEKNVLKDLKKVNKLDGAIGAAYLGGDFDAYVNDLNDKIDNETSLAYMFSLVSANVYIDPEGNIINVTINAVLDEHFKGERPEKLENITSLDIVAGHAENNGKVGYEASISLDGAIDKLITGRGTYNKKSQELTGTAYVQGIEVQGRIMNMNLTMESLQFLTSGSNIKLDGKLVASIEGFDKLKVNMIMTSTSLKQRIDFGINYDSMSIVTGDITVIEEN